MQQWKNSLRSSIAYLRNFAGVRLNDGDKNRRAALFRADCRNLANGLSPHMPTDLGGHPLPEQFSVTVKFPFREVSPGTVGAVTIFPQLLDNQ
jgi:hypothetical protein